MTTTAARQPGPTTRPAGASAGPAIGSAARRILGLALILLVLVPVYRLLDTPLTGVAGSRTVIGDDATAAFLRLASMLLLIPAILAARMVRSERLEAMTRAMAGLLVRPRAGLWAAALAGIVTVLTWVFCVSVLKGRPMITDAMAQLLHARFLAAGHWAVALEGIAPFRHVQNAVSTPHGWVSQYPPGFVALLALGMRFGSATLVGPLLAGVTVFFTSLSAERLLSQRAVARLGSALVAVSPFVIGLAGAFMNHVAVAAAGAIALYAALRACDGRLAWAALAGAALGFAFAVRPLGAISVGLPLTLGVWMSRRLPARATLVRIAWAGAAALPFLVLLAVYNRYFFGSPLRFGYDVAWGANTGLGFHADPWGNRYGPLQALAWTSSDLLALSLNLLETPLPVVPLVGAYLLLAKRLSFGEKVLLGWAVVPVAANILYWHHGLFLGPRMLNEAAPAWVLLTVVSAVGLVRMTPGQLAIGGAPYSPRAGLAGAFVAALLAAGVLAPQRLGSAGQGYRSLLSSVLPPTPGPAIVFVHDAWTARLAARLAARGMPLDSVETALRQNDACDLQRFVDARERPGDSPVAVPRIDFDPRATDLPDVAEITPGDGFRTRGPDRITPACRREIGSDRFGIVDIMPFLWQTDLPGLPGRGALVVRDLGPTANAELIRRLPGRTPMAYVRPAPESDPVLVRYDEAMVTLWGGPQPAAGSGPAMAGAP